MMLIKLMHNVLAKTAVAPGPTITNYRFVPLMSR